MKGRGLWTEADLAWVLLGEEMKEERVQGVWKKRNEIIPLPFYTFLGSAPAYGVQLGRRMNKSNVNL